MNIATSPAAMAGVSEEEWKTRCDLAALYRLIAHFGWTDLVYTHLSARVPGPHEHFLINQYGVLFNEMRASDLVKVDLDGIIVDQNASGTRAINLAGYTIHSAIHMARPDLTCVIHTHTPAGIAVSCQKQGLLSISQHSMRFHEHIAYHDYEGIALDLAERERLIADLGEHKAMILRNHGLLACGGSIPEAFLRIYFMERSCQAQIQALNTGAELVYPSEEVCQHTAKQTQANRTVDTAWKSALTLIEHTKPDYRT